MKQASKNKLSIVKNDTNDLHNDDNNNGNSLVFDNQDNNIANKEMKIQGMK